MAMNLDQSADKITPSSGGLTVAGLILNSNSVSTNFTIPTSFNGFMTGPVTISTGVTLTVSTGSRFVVV
jgi:hypothetical protein